MGWNALLPYGNDHYHIPFPSPNRNDANEIARFNFRMGKYANIGPIGNMNLPVETVNLSDLSQGQPDLFKKTMDSLMKLSPSKIENIKDPTASSDIPFVIKYNNTYQIQDGHHRLSALYAKGRKRTKVRVLDLNKLF